MSVQSEIDRIEQNVANAYSVLEGAGAEMPQSRNSNNLPGTAASIKAVLYAEQTLTEEQQAQARENIGVLAPFCGVTSEITPNQVSAALLQGQNVVLAHIDSTYGVIYFSGFLEVPALGVVAASGVQMYYRSGVPIPMRFSLAGDKSSGKWAFLYGQLADFTDIPGALPNPNKLTFSGVVSGEYDGSAAKTITIPAVSYNAQSLTAAQKTQARKNLGVVGTVTPQDYGAKGDGSTDDTTAFQNALAANRTVFVPGGTYKLSGALVIRDNCGLELSQDVVLNFTQTSGNCITLNRSAFLKGNHATVNVPYGFTGNVINADTSVHTDTKDVPPFNHWDPQWKTARYLTDLNICKANSSGLHVSNSGDSNGTAVYICADGSATSTFVWALNFSGLRIAGAFEYGIRAQNLSDGYNHEMRIEAFMDACKIGVSLEDCNNAYISATIQPRKADNGTTYAEHGIKLVRSENTDLTGSRVWDWNGANSKWVNGGVYQHIAMYGNCVGTIMNDYNYHYLPAYISDIRDIIYFEEEYKKVNLDSLIILQEPFTRWFKPVDNEPYFFDGEKSQRLVTSEEFTQCIDAERKPNFTDRLSSAKDRNGATFNGIGYKKGCFWATDGMTLTTSDYLTCTGLIQCATGDTIHVKGMSFNEGNDDCRVILYDSSYTKIMHINRNNLIQNASYYYVDNYVETEDGFTLDIVRAGAAYISFSVFNSTVKRNPVVTANEEISWSTTGHLQDGIKVKSENVEGLSEILGSYITDVDTLIGGG